MTGLLKATNKKTKSTNPKLTQDDIVYGHIFDAILEQRLPPGTKLSEEALGEIFGVSRTIIRRALLRLSIEQVVSTRPNRGSIVASPSVDEALQILKAREVMELLLLNWLQNMPPANKSPNAAPWSQKNMKRSPRTTPDAASDFPVNFILSWPPWQTTSR